MSSDGSIPGAGGAVVQPEEYLGQLRFDRPPFVLAPDPDLIFWTDANRRAADTLGQGIEHGSPVILLTGEVGTGKTTLLQDVLTAPDLTSGFLPQVGFAGQDLWAWILLAFGQRVTEGSPATLFCALQDFLVAEHGAGRRAILVADDAHSASDADLDSLRQLTNLDRGTRTLLQVVIAGHPDLRERLRAPRYASLTVRIGADAQLSPMQEGDTAGYVRHRLGRAGGSADTFSPDALVEVHRCARGVPGRTNLLCDLCLTEAFRREVSEIDAALVRDVVAAARQGGMFAGSLDPRAEDDAESRPLDAPTTPASPPRGYAPTRETPLAMAPAAPASDRAAARARLDVIAGGGIVSLDSRKNPEASRRGQRPETATSAANCTTPVETPKPSRLDPERKASSPEDARDDATDVLQLAFDAMDSLAELRGAQGTKGDTRKKPLSLTKLSASNERTSTSTSDQPQPTEDRPAAQIYRTRGAVFALGTALVGLVVLALNSYMVWSVFDMFSDDAVSESPIIAVATDMPVDQMPGPNPPSPNATTPMGDADPAAGRSDPKLRPALTTPALPTIAAPQASADELFALALDLTLDDKDASAIALARAASRGHARAAYYLAQNYETGEGVPRNLSLARAWYAVSDVPRAESRLGELDVETTPSDIAAPVLLSAARTCDGALELVWTSAVDGSGVEYLVEVLDRPDGLPLVSERVPYSALRVPAPPGELLWGVTAATASEARASDLQKIPAERQTRDCPAR